MGGGSQKFLQSPNVGVVMVSQLLPSIFEQAPPEFARMQWLWPVLAKSKPMTVGEPKVEVQPPEGAEIDNGK